LATLKIGGFNIPAEFNIDLDIFQISQGFTSCFLNFAFGVVCDAGFIFLDPVSKFYSKFRPLFSRLGQTHSFISGQYASENGILLI
jgi:hypothetical protein